MANTPSMGRRRPPAKCVDVKFLRDWVPEMARRRVDLSTAWGIIQKQYCAALVGRGVCPVECQVCREALVKIFELDKATNPEALLTWRAKEQSAIMIETLIEQDQFPMLETEGHHDPLAALFQKPSDDNLFLSLAKEYE